MQTSPLLGVAALVAAVVAGGCSAAASPRAELVRSLRDPPIYVRPDDVERYVCSDGLFVCEDPVGRTSQRLCRCVP